MDRKPGGTEPSPAIETSCVCPRCGNTTCLQGPAYYDRARDTVLGSSKHSPASVAGAVLVLLVLAGNVLVPRLLLPRFFGIYDWNPGWLIYVPLIVAAGVFVFLEFRRQFRAVTLQRVEALKCLRCGYRWRV